MDKSEFDTRPKWHETTEHFEKKYAQARKADSLWWKTQYPLIKHLDEVVDSDHDVAITRAQLIKDEDCRQWVEAGLWQGRFGDFYNGAIDDTFDLELAEMLATKIVDAESEEYRQDVEAMLFR